MKRTEMIKNRSRNEEVDGDEHLRKRFIMKKEMEAQSLWDK